MPTGAEAQGSQMGPPFGGRAEVAPHSLVAPSSEGGRQKQPRLSGAGKGLCSRSQRLTAGGHQCHRVLCAVPLDSALWVGGPVLVLAFGLLQAIPRVGFSHGRARKKEV